MVAIPLGCKCQTGSIYSLIAATGTNLMGKKRIKILRVIAMILGQGFMMDGLEGG